MKKEIEKFFRTIDGRLYLSQNMENYQKLKLKSGSLFLTCLWIQNVEKNMN